MPLTRQQKERLVEGYRDGVAVAPHVFLIDFKGVTVTQDTELRRRIREIGGSYGVVKNRLVLRAIDGRSLEELKEHFSGPTAVAYCADDPVGLAKAVTEFGKDLPTFEIKAGLLDGRPVAAADVRQIASLPSRQELITKLLFLLQSPVASLVRNLAAVPRQLTTVVGRILEQKQGAGSG